MFELNSLPIPGGVIIAGITSAALFGFALGPLVADRTINKSGWHHTCVTDLQERTTAALPSNAPTPSINCSEMMGLFGQDANQLCDLGGNAFFLMLMLDPLAGQKEQVRRQATARLSRIAELAPSRCSCASSVVASERLSWGLYAGSARIVGGPNDLKAELTAALHSPTCARLGEVE